MKKSLIVKLMIIFTVFTQTGKPQDITNDFYDDTETFSLKGPTTIQVAGDRAVKVVSENRLLKQ